MASRIYTGKKICKSRKEFLNLMNALYEEGYHWANGDSLKDEFFSDTSYCLNHLPVLLVFDAKYKDVYYTKYINTVLSIDPNYR